MIFLFRCGFGVSLSVYVKRKVEIILASLCGIVGVVAGKVVVVHDPAVKSHVSERLHARRKVYAAASKLYHTAYRVYPICAVVSGDSVAGIQLLVVTSLKGYVLEVNVRHSVCIAAHSSNLVPAAQAYLSGIAAEVYKIGEIGRDTSELQSR